MQICICRVRVEYVNLSDICKINMGQSPESTSYNSDKQGVPFYQGNADFGALYPNPRIWCSKPIKLAKENDILISVRAPVGALNFSKEECCIGRGLAAITLVSNDFLIEFIYWSLRTGVKELQSKSTGSTFKSINKKVLEEVRIPKISLKDQEGIIRNITLLTNILTKYEQETVFLDELVKARFVEMFGDPIENQKDWEVVKIRDIVTDVRYGTSKPAVEGGRYPYLRMNNLTVDGGLDLSDLKYIDIPDNEIEKCVVRKGDILFNRTNSIDLIGKTAVFNLLDDMVIAGYIIRIRLNDQILPDVFSQYMNLEAMKKVLRGMAKGAVNQANINAQELQSIKVYIPNMELQKQYVEFKEEIDKSRSRIQKSLEASQELFDSLMQEYFG